MFSARRARARAGRVRRVEQPAEDERLAEHRGRLAHGQRRVLLQRAARDGEACVQSVAELVGEHEDVAAAAGVVEHHVGMDARRGVGAEGAAALVRAYRSVDPVLVEEALGEVAEDGRELVEGAEHEVGGLGPVDRDLLVGHRGHAVVVGELVEAEQLGLEAIPAPWQLVVGAHGLEQRLHRLVAGLVGQVARREPVRIGAQAIIDGLVLQQGVEDVRARAQARLERRGDGLRRGAAHLAVGGGQAAEGDVERDPLLGIGELDADRARQLGEQARPGVATSQRLLGEELLLGL